MCLRFAGFTRLGSSIAPLCFTRTAAAASFTLTPLRNHSRESSSSSSSGQSEPAITSTAAHKVSNAKSAVGESNSGSSGGGSNNSLFGGAALGTDNTKEFWEGAWATRTLPWTAAEKHQPFTRHLALYYTLRAQEEEAAAAAAAAAGTEPSAEHEKCMTESTATPGDNHCSNNNNLSTNNHDAITATHTPPASDWCAVGDLPSSLSSLSLPVCVTRELIHAHKRTGGYLTGPEEEALVRAQLAGRTVLVPLCGDTRAVPYMVRAGAATVIGGDLSPEALRLQRENNFPGVTFTCTEEQVAGGATVRVHEATVGGRTRVLLFEGDFLALRESPAFAAAGVGRVDLVYDRASFMAINPALRERYVAVVAATLRRDTDNTGMVVEGPVRDAGDTSGPPYAFEADELLSLVVATAPGALAPGGVKDGNGGDDGGCGKNSGGSGETTQCCERNFAMRLLSHDTWVGMAEGENLPRSYKWHAVYPRGLYKR